mmetsp:Transcript_80007/g.159038  ORF Transcript_80007/g.159038 Transcript_80007/m.159038 type:complete len:248 (+) Transcript_80007:589-1332(+)
MMALESMMVCSRWAIVSTVASAKTFRMADCKMASVSLSIDAVASSSTITCDLRSIALARQMSCRCPTEKLAPASPTEERSPSLRALMGASSCVSEITRLSSSSECVPNGSRLYLTVSLKSTGSCMMIASRERKEESRSVERSTPSTSSAPAWPTNPLVGSTSRQSVAQKVDLPEPVRPTTPTLARASMMQLTWSSESGSSGRYRTHKSVATMRPAVGHTAGASSPPFDSAGSWSAYSKIRSTPAIPF